VAEQLTTVHCLQAFNPRYFALQPKLFSYSQENAAAAARALAPRLAAQAFAAVLPPQPIGDQATLAQVVQALTKSARFFAHQRLQLTLPFEQPSIEDSEPMELDGLDRYALSTQLAEAALAGRDPASLLRAVAADGKLPHGYVGDNAFAEANSLASVVTAAIAHHAPGASLPPAHLSNAVGGWQLSGSLGPFTMSALVRHRTANTHGGDLLAAWISHLALCLARPAGYPLRTAIIGTDGTYTFPALSAEAAATTLPPLLELYARAHAEALPLFPKSSLAYAEKLLAKPGDPAAALTAAGTAWNGNSFQRTRGEADDEWNALLWREHANPLGADFQQLAIAVFGPLLQHLTQEGGGK
jgi:exodeoxyribonuclease V gamma subunit